MEEANVRPWSDLPSEILASIKSELLGRDFCSFNGVCRSWRSVPYLVPSLVRLIEPSTTLLATSQFPLLFFTGEDNSMCKFYNPANNTTYAMDVPEIASATIRFSKDGWLLMSQDHAMFFFNPFTKERIDLPDLDRQHTFTGIAFSSKPTSSDCVVFGIKDVEFVLIRHDEDTWHKFFVNDYDWFFPSRNNPVFYNGLFYCLNLQGKLGTFDPKEDDIHGWTVLNSPTRPRDVSIWKNYLVECNGELLSVFEGPVGKWIKVFKLDRESMSWQEVDSLGDEMLFVSLCTSLSATSTKTQVNGVGNKIYFPKFQATQSVFYSLGTGRFHSFRTKESNENFYGTTEMMQCTWIEPSFERHSDEELCWYSSSTDSEEEE